MRRLGIRRAALRSLAAAAGLCAQAPAARAQDVVGSQRWAPWILGTQLNFIAQDLRPFHSPYSGRNSLRPDGDAALSQAYGVYLGAVLFRGLEAYADIELIGGDAVGSASGLAGVTNGDALRQGTVDLGRKPYIARAFVRWTIPSRGAGRDTLVGAPDQAATIVPARRVELVAGELAITDLMDGNRYAGSTRLAFTNWGLIQNTAWDYPADTRGYSMGVGAALITPRWSLRAASFLMPTFANGNTLDWAVTTDRGDAVEFTLHPGSAGTVIRTLVWMNHARMGRYAAAIRDANLAMTKPDIVADDAPGRVKYGYGVNIEQPVADSGETGAFVRLGWSDGETESFAFTEVDRHVSIGVQVSGRRWGRARDLLGIGFVHHDLSPLHREYLRLGGTGFLLGDGTLTYGPEMIAEAYYRIQLGRWVQVSPDVQAIRNPGYNQDRGPVTVLGLRLNVRY